MESGTVFSEREQEVLRLLAEGRNIGQVATELKLSLSGVKSVLSGLYRRGLGPPVHKATAAYGNWMGLHGQSILSQTGLEPKLEGGFYPVVPGRAYRIGGLQLPASLIAAPTPTKKLQVTGVSSSAHNEPPIEHRDQIDELRDALERRDAQEGRVRYEKHGRLFVVNDLEGADETYNPITLTLGRSRYFTIRAVQHNLDDAMKQKYVVDPLTPITTALPLPIGVALHLVVGTPPRLIVTRRSANLGGLTGILSSTAEGWAEPDEDLTFSRGKQVLDFGGAMIRELKEERPVLSLLGVESIVGEREWIQSIEHLSLIFNYMGLNYCVVGWLRIPKIDPKAVIELESQAKEGTYSVVPFPDLDADNSDYERVQKPLRAICEHLTSTTWGPAAIGLVELLKRHYGVDTISTLMGRPVESE